MRSFAAPTVRVHSHNYLCNAFTVVKTFYTFSNRFGSLLNMYVVQHRVAVESTACGKRQIVFTERIGTGSNPAMYFPETHQKVLRVANKVLSKITERSGPQISDRPLSEISACHHAACGNSFSPKYTASGVRRPKAV